jgi:hypothetical protein
MQGAICYQYTLQIVHSIFILLVVHKLAIEYQKIDYFKLTIIVRKILINGFLFKIEKQ